MWMNAMMELITVRPMHRVITKMARITARAMRDMMVMEEIVQVFYYLAQKFYDNLKFLLVMNSVSPKKATL